MLNIFSNQNTMRNNGLFNSGYTMPDITTTGIISTNLAYSIKNFNVNELNYEINKRILSINEEILENTHQHMEQNVLYEVLIEIKKNNELLEKLIQLQDGKK